MTDSLKYFGAKIKLSRKFRVHLLDFYLILKQIIKRDYGFQHAAFSKDILRGVKLQSRVDCQKHSSLAGRWQSTQTSQNPPVRLGRLQCGKF